MISDEAKYVGLDTMEQSFSRRMSRLTESAVRDLLKIARKPGIISFAGGFPSAELFPVEGISECVASVLRERGADALQYGLSEGVLELRQWVADRLRGKHRIKYGPDDMLIVSGSQQALDLVGKVFIDPGDMIALEEPCYVGAIQAFAPYEPEYFAAPSDEHGIIPELFEQALRDAAVVPKLLYVVTNFSNPTGATLPDQRRYELVRVCNSYGITIIEDDPYGDLRFEGEDVAPLQSYDAEADVVYCGSASKILAPGLRVAWIATKNAAIREQLARVKQASDLQSGSLTQHIFLRFAHATAEFEKHIETIRHAYKR